MEVKDLPNRCGVYAIDCDGKSYVGSSINIRARVNAHLSNLKNGRHHNKELQQAYNSSQGNITIRILCFCSEEFAIAVEEKWIKRLRPNVYNKWTTHKYLPPVSVVADRLLKNTIKKDTNECWEWTGRTKKGRPYASFGDKKGYWVNRLAYYVGNGGKNPGPNVVRHTCNNPMCCNPNHLILGSYADNSRDYQSTLQIGERSSLFEHADAIKKARQNGATYEELEAIYKVNASRIGVFVNKIAPELRGIRNGMSTRDMAIKRNKDKPQIKKTQKPKQSIRKIPLEIFTAFGETKTFVEWLKDPRCSVKDRDSIKKRILHGFTPEQALTLQKYPSGRGHTQTPKVVI